MLDMAAASATEAIGPAQGEAPLVPASATPKMVMVKVDTQYQDRMSLSKQGREYTGMLQAELGETLELGISQQTAINLYVTLQGMRQRGVI